jgi:hypothetical protein
MVGFTALAKPGLSFEIARFRVEIKKSLSVFSPQRLFPVLCLPIISSVAVVVEGEECPGKIN